MEIAREQFLAGSGLAADQHADLAAGDPRRLIVDLAHGGNQARWVGRARRFAMGAVRPAVWSFPRGPATLTKRCGGAQQRLKCVRQSRAGKRDLELDAVARRDRDLGGGVGALALAGEEHAGSARCRLQNLDPPARQAFGAAPRRPPGRPRRASRRGRSGRRGRAGDPRLKASSTVGPMVDGGSSAPALSVSTAGKAPEKAIPASRSSSPTILDPRLDAAEPDRDPGLDARSARDPRSVRHGCRWTTRDRSASRPSSPTTRVAWFRETVGWPILIANPGSIR